MRSVRGMGRAVTRGERLKRKSGYLMATTGGVEKLLKGRAVTHGGERLLKGESGYSTGERLLKGESGYSRGRAVT